MPWRTGAYGPTGGGLVPNTIGAPLTDPWGTDYGYCAWEVGPGQTLCGGAHLLNGTTAPTTDPAPADIVIAIISAGPNRTFNSTCSAYVNSASTLVAPGGDDVVVSYTYQQAATATSSLWTLSPTSTSTAVINKTLAVGPTGSPTFTVAPTTGNETAGTINALSLVTTGAIISGGKVQLADDVATALTTTAVTSCAPADVGSLRYNTTNATNNVDICLCTGVWSGSPLTCSASTWTPVGGSGGNIWTHSGTYDYLTTTTDYVGIGTTTPQTALTVVGPISLQSPSTPPCTSNAYTVAAANSSLNFADAAGCTVTLPTASLFPGRILMMSNTAAGAVVSASSNVIPQAGGAAAAAILPANAAGVWAELQSNGTNWVIMATGGEAVIFNNDNTVACSSTTLGQVRYNTTTHVPEFCNSIIWTPFNIATPTVNLVLTPVSNYVMNVDGSCGNSTCYSTNVTFILQNQGTLTSAAITDALSNIANFEFVSDTCTGNTLTPNQQCAIVVNAMDTGNGSYTGVLQVTANNSPFAILGGTASNFGSGCIVGRAAPGGIYAACNLGGGTYDLVVTPGGCTSTTTNPTCGGGADTLVLTSNDPNMWNYLVSYGTWFNSANDGAQNSVNALSFPAAITGISWCDQLVYGGYSDWYLPAQGEMQSFFYPNKAAIGGFVNAGYITSYSSYYNGPYMYYVNMADNSAGDAYSSGWSLYIRCARRDRLGLPSAQLLTTPRYSWDPIPNGDNYSNTMTSLTGVTGTANTLVTSSNFYINAINTGITATVSGGGSPAFSVNGGGWVTSATVHEADRIELEATTPTGGGTYTVTFSAGGVNLTWALTALNPSTGYFVLSAGTYNGNLGGMSGADATCLTELTTHTGWQGYATANGNGQLVSSKVHAFLCYGTNYADCMINLLPLTTYYFASAGDPAAGGTSFTTDSGMTGPHDNNTWSLSNIFNGSYTYWIGSRYSGDPQSFGSTSGWNQCNAFTDGTSGQSSGIGMSNSWSNPRYGAGTVTCNQLERLICFVNP